MKLWLKGEKAGQSETLVDNLPGCPDNIHLAPNGSFWIALQQLNSPLLDLTGGRSIAKRVLASFPALVERAKAGLRRRAMVAQVSENGDILRLLDDSEGKVMGLVTSATEFDGHLYIGGLGADFVGKLSLAQLATQ
uniref:Strictosidine synthase conserved region domain-containing protein n=1 Tax=Arundo donax TaxID=35708 RepID=A0A0A9HTT5_ARUDO